MFLKYWECPSCLVGGGSIVPEYTFQPWRALYINFITCYTLLFIDRQRDRESQTQTTITTRKHGQSDRHANPPAASTRHWWPCDRHRFTIVWPWPLTFWTPLS